MGRKVTPSPGALVVLSWSLSTTIRCRAGSGSTAPEAEAGALLGLATMPFLGRWIDRGARSAAVAGAMAIRVLGVAALLATSGLGGSGVWGFAVAALFLGVGDQCRPPAHAAPVGTVAEARYRRGTDDRAPDDRAPVASSPTGGGNSGVSVSG